MRSRPRVCSRGRLSKALSICSREPLGRGPSYWFSMRMATVIRFPYIKMSHRLTHMNADPKQRPESASICVNLRLKLVGNGAETGAADEGGVFCEDTGFVTSFGWT